MLYLIIVGLGLRIKDRYRFPRTNNIKENRKYLYLLNLYKEKDNTNKGVTLFFALKC